MKIRIEVTDLGNTVVEERWDGHRADHQLLRHMAQAALQQVVGMALAVRAGKLAKAERKFKQKNA